VTGKPNNTNNDVKAAYWGNYTEEEYWLGKTGQGNAVVAAVGLLEGDFSYAIRLFEAKGGEIPPCVLHVILQLMKGEGEHPGTNGKAGFEVRRIGQKVGAPDRSKYMGTAVEKGIIAQRMIEQYERNGEKYEIAAEDVARSCGVSVRKVKSAYSSYKDWKKF
jgi:hypothetical protein